MTINRRHAILVFSAALLARLVYALLLSPGPLSADSSEYLSIAGNLLSSGAYSIDGAAPAIQRAPGYPFFAALTGLFSGGVNLPFLLACQVLLDSVSAVYALALAAAFLPPAWALGAGLLYALHPVFIAFSAQALSETLFMHFWLAFLLVSRRSLSSGRAAGWAGAGALLALAALTRPAHMYFLVPFAVLLFALAGLRAGAVRLALLAGTFALCLAPWTLRNYRVTGAFLPVCTGGAFALWVGSVPGTAYPDDLAAAVPLEKMKTVEGEAILSRLAKDNWRAHAPAILKTLPRRLAKFWLTSHSSVFRLEQANAAYAAQGRYGALALKAALLLLQALTLGLALAGAFLLRARAPDAAFLLLPAVFVSAHILNDWGPSRYHISALPPLGVLAMYALSRFTARAAKK